MQMRYSREHEIEADVFALAALHKACLPPSAFADILQRLQNQAFGDEERGDEKSKQAKASKKTQPQKHSSGVPEMLSTHPDTQARIKPFLEAKLNCN
jgi:Zn-dependent protease with chaperone function